MSKPGMGGLASSQDAAISRRQRLRELHAETVDLKNDPYFMRNHLGSFECKLCLTLHMNETSYLSHTDGRRHQHNLKRRAAKQKQAERGSLKSGSALTDARRRALEPRKKARIGTPGYKVVKQKHAASGQLSLLFRVHYPAIESGFRPRHRFASTYAQKVEAADRNYQFVLFAAEPYDTIGFKVPNFPIDKDPSKLLTHWNKDTKNFTLQLFFDATPENYKRYL